MGSRESRWNTILGPVAKLGTRIKSPLLYQLSYRPNLRQRHWIRLVGLVKQLRRVSPVYPNGAPESIGFRAVTTGGWS